MIKTPIWKYVKDDKLSLIKINPNAELKLFLDSAFYDENKELFFEIKENSKNSIFFKGKVDHETTSYSIKFLTIGIYEGRGFAKVQIINNKENDLYLSLKCFQYFENDDILKEGIKFEMENYM